MCERILSNLNLMEILLQFFHTSATDIFKNIFPFTVFFFAKTCFLRTSIFLDVFPSSPLSFIFGSLPLRLSVDLFSTSFFPFCHNLSFNCFSIFSALTKYSVLRSSVNSTSLWSFSLSSQFCSSFFVCCIISFFLAPVLSVSVLGYFRYNFPLL